MQKARSHPSRQPKLPRRLLPLVGTRFQVLFHSPPGVLFTFPSRYSCTIGRGRVFSLGGWSPSFSQSSSVPPAYSGTATIRRVFASPTGLSPSVAERSNSLRLTISIGRVNPVAAPQPR